MSLLNNGTQTIIFDFKYPAKGKDFSKLLRNVIKQGIYYGADLSYTGNIVTISPFKAVFNSTDGTDDEMSLAIKTSANATITATDPTKTVLVMSFTYTEATENYIDFEFRESSASVTNEVILGTVTFSGSTIIDITEIGRTYGTLDVNDNVIAEKYLVALSDPAGDTHVGNRSYNDARYPSKDDLNSRMQITENKLMDLSIENSYLMGKVSSSSDYFIETFMNEKRTGDFNSPSITDATIMDDNDWNNNWKETNGESLDYKQGYMRPKLQAYKGEIIDQFDLDGIGLNRKGSISQWDSKNQCYWLLTYIQDNDIGQILKISDNMKDGKINVLASYYLPASGTAMYWTGIDSDGDRLFFGLHGTSISTSKVYSIVINSDGSIGEPDYEVYNGQQVNITNSIENSHTSAGSGNDNGYYLDICIWDDNDIMVFTSLTATFVNLICLDKATLGAGTYGDILGFKNYIGGSTTWHRSIVRHGNYLYSRVMDVTDDYRYIFRFQIDKDIVNNTVINSSGLWQTSRDIDDIGVSAGGATISKDGYLLEITNTSSNGKFISKRAMKDAPWCENSISGFYAYNASTNPDNTRTCMVEANRYYWASDYSAGTDDCDVYRFDTITGTYKHARLTGPSWNLIGDLTYNPNTDVLYIMGRDSGNNYEVYYGDLSTFVGLMGDTYDTGNNVDITSWGTLASGIGASNLDLIRSLCYDGDADLIYIANDTDDKIDTLSIDGATWTQGVYDLPAAGNTWYGLAYKNYKIYIGDYNGTSTPNKIYVLDTNLSTASAWYRIHIYTQAGATWYGSFVGSLGIDFDGDDLVLAGYATDGPVGSDGGFFTLKVLEDPDVLQLHTFMDSSNILSYDTIGFATSIAERYFEPEDFSDIRDCPDKNYCAIGGATNGFSLLHLDEYLSDRTSTGKARYDVRKIRVQNYKDGANNVVEGTVNSNLESLFIEKDIIFFGQSAGGGYGLVIDLKSGIATVLSSGGGGAAGKYYDGTLSERNDAKGFAGVENGELYLSNGGNRKTHARTFTKDDPTDYNKENPTTYVALATDAGCDLLVIDWDSNNNRTPVKVWNNIFENQADNGQRSVWIAPSGYIFAGEESSSGTIYTIETSNGSGVWNPVWDINTETTNSYRLAVVTGINSEVYDIAPNSKCWKTPTGEWRHILLCGTHDESAGASDFWGLFLVDVENDTEEVIWEYDDSGADTDDGFNQCDLSDEFAFGITGRNLDGTEETDGLCIFKKYRFDDSVDTSYSNGWTIAKTGRYKTTANVTHFRKDTYPIFTLTTNGVTGQSRVCRFSQNHNILIMGTSLTGAQFIHLPFKDESVHESTDVTCSNPESYHHIRNTLTNDSIKFEQVSIDDGNITYTNGDSENWSSKGANTTADSAGDYVEPAENIDDGFGTFGRDNIGSQHGEINPHAVGEELVKSNNTLGDTLVEGTDYEYDKALDNSDGEGYNIYDTGDSGAFASNRHFRIVEDGTNVADAGGLNLNIIAKDLTSMNQTPPQDEAWVDPYRGRFILPRPSYFSRCEDEKALVDPDIYIYNQKPIDEVIGSVHQFNEIGMHTNAMHYDISQNGMYRLYPFGYNSCSSEGTIAMYLNMETGSSTKLPSTKVHIGDNAYVDFSHDLSGNPNHSLYVDGAVRATDAITAINSVSGVCTYISWNTEGSLDDGSGNTNDTVVVFFGGMSGASMRTSTKFSASRPLKIESTNSGVAVTNVWWDNVKIWKEAIHDGTDATEWIYNGTVGREDALHYIYGATNDYAPVLNGASSGAGYSYIDVSDTIDIDQGSGSQGKLEWENITGKDLVGINFVKDTDAGKALVVVTNETTSTTTLSGVVDLYDAGNGETEDDEFVYWVDLNSDYQYTVEVRHNGDYNASSASPYDVMIRRFFTGEELIDSDINATLITWDSDNPNDTYHYEDLDVNTTSNLYIDSSFNGDNNTTQFAIKSPNLHASEFIQWSTNSGIAWDYPEDLGISSWGGNSPDYDDETIDSGGHFWVNFASAPLSGVANVVLKWKPVANTCKLKRKWEMANDGKGYKKETGQSILLDDSLEIVK